jgi:hypothetical protein
MRDEDALFIQAFLTEDEIELILDALNFYYLNNSLTAVLQQEVEYLISHLEDL